MDRRGNDLGQPIPIAEAGEHIAGFCLLNDWSARDIQGVGYQRWARSSPELLTSVSPWIVRRRPAPFRGPMPRGRRAIRTPPYLDDPNAETMERRRRAEVTLSTQAMRDAGLPPHRLSHGNAAAAMYWSDAQIVTHHASNGCNLQPGDLIGTGTLSTQSDEGLGSLIEISRGGKQPIALPSGETRSFLEDGDENTLNAWCEREGAVRIGW